MYYEFDLTIPAQTSQGQPVELAMPLYPGTVEMIEIMFPDGCYSLAHARILEGLVQIIPRNPEGSVKANNALIRFSERYRLETAPYTLTARGWNDDDSYPHTATIRLLLSEGTEAQTYIPTLETVPIPASLQ